MNYMIFTLIILLLAGCSSSTDPADHQACSVDTQCKPTPGCHPTDCINSRYADHYTQPQMCTMMYKCGAAYSDDDCVCNAGKCENLKLKLGDPACEDAPKEAIPDTKQAAQTKKIVQSSKADPKQDLISLCDSFCLKDKDKYCQETRTLPDTNITGTCRAFARKGNIPGFTKCPQFCQSYPTESAKCSVNNEIDENCDGKADS